MRIKNTRMKNVTLRQTISADVTPKFQDSFENDANEATVGLSAARTVSHTENGYAWGSSEGSSYNDVYGTGSNGMFIRTDRHGWPPVTPWYWVDGLGEITGSVINFSGSLLYLLGADYKPIDGSPFAVTSNTATTMSFSGDATGAVYVEPFHPRVSNTRAKTGSQCRKFVFGPTSVSTGSYSDARSEQNFSFPACLAEGWMEWWLHVPANYSHYSPADGATNNKGLVLWNNTYGGDGNCWGYQTFIEGATSTTSLYAYYANRGNGEKFDIYPTDTNEWAPHIDFISPTGPAYIGDWNRIRCHWKASSGKDVADGKWHMWVYNNAVDGNILLRDLTQNYFPLSLSGSGENGKFTRSGSTWYSGTDIRGTRYNFYDADGDFVGGPWEATGWEGVTYPTYITFTGDATGATVVRAEPGVNRGYLLGAANSGFLLRTEFCIDDFKVYDTNPGW